MQLNHACCLKSKWKELESIFGMSMWKHIQEKQIMIKIKQTNTN